MQHECQLQMYKRGLPIVNIESQSQGEHQCQLQIYTITTLEDYNTKRAHQFLHRDYNIEFINI